MLLQPDSSPGSMLQTFKLASGDLIAFFPVGRWEAIAEGWYYGKCFPYTTLMVDTDTITGPHHTLAQAVSVAAREYDECIILENDYDE